jgi:hypothetical protein
LPQVDPSQAGLVQIKVTTQELFFGGLGFSKLSVSPKLVGLNQHHHPFHGGNRHVLQAYSFWLFFAAAIR